MSIERTPYKHLLGMQDVRDEYLGNDELPLPLLMDKFDTFFETRSSSSDRTLHFRFDHRSEKAMYASEPQNYIVYTK